MVWNWWTQLKSMIGMEAETEMTVEDARTQEQRDKFDQLLKDREAKQDQATAAARQSAEVLRVANEEKGREEERARQQAAAAAANAALDRQHAKEDMEGLSEWDRTHGQYQNDRPKLPKDETRYPDGTSDHSYRGGRSDPKPPTIGTARFRDREPRR